MSEMTLRQAADQLGLSLYTLRNWRGKGRGPRTYKIAGRVFMRQADLDAWLIAQEQATSRGDAVNGSAG